MATITIASTILPNYHHEGTDHTIRIFSDKSWVAEDGTIVPGRGDNGTFYKEYTVSVAEPLATIPQVVLLSQTDAPNEKNARYSIYHYVDGVEKDMFLANTLGAFQVPATPAATEWSDLEQYNFNTHHRYYKDDKTYSALTIDQKIAAVTGTTNLATSTFAALPVASTAGRQRLLTDVDESVYVDNGTQWYSTTHGVFDFKRFGGVGDGVTSNTTILTSIIAAIGASQGTIVFPFSANPYVIGAETVPANVTLDFSAGGQIKVTTGTTLTTAGPIIAPPRQIFTNVTSGLGTWALTGNKVLTDFYPEWYGTTGDGVTDDQPKLQALTDAMDTGSGGTLHISKTNHALGSTWTVGSAATQHYINIKGQGPVRSILTWTGATNSIALKLNNEKYVSIGGFRIDNGVAAGTTEGVRSTGTNSGTNTNGLNIDNLIIDGFHYGWHTSDGGTNTSSELNFRSVQFQNCDVGFFNDSFNAISMNFYLAGFASCGVGLQNNAGTEMNVFGASFSNNDNDVTANATVSLYGVYIENTVNESITFTGGPSYNLTIRDSTIGNGTSTPNSHQIISIVGGGKATIENCAIYGQISFRQGSATSSLSLRNNKIIDPDNTYTAVATPDLMGPGFRLQINNGGGGSTFDSFGNTRMNGDISTVAGVWPSGSGYITTSATGQGIAVMKSGIGAGVALSVSGNAIAPTSPIHSVGAGLIKNITVPTGFNVGLFYAIPTAAFTTDLTGNIGLAITAVVGQIVLFVYDGVSKWWPSMGGALTVPSLTTPGQITSTLATGTAPLVIASTTKVSNLNVDQLDGADWAAPAAIGTGTPAAGTFTTVAGTTITGSVGLAVAATGKLNVAPTVDDTWGAAISLDVTISNHDITAVFATSATCTITPTAAGSAGDWIFINTINGAGGSVVVTFASTFHSSGTQTTQASRFSSIAFRSDGTRWIEQYRTTDLV